ncbi:MAG TPA: metallophosphoesterase family protein [Candidatus Krumholzibacteria bacterium]|nr:metallophosphoesterase family protein [Candidatus Krumholzibacteria bacterium]
MQRVAALYDIHGNLPALEAVLEDVRREAVDAIVVGGDVMPGPMPRECLDLIYSTGIRTEFVRGNGESAAFESLRGGTLEKIPEPFREGIRWSANELPDKYVAALTSWPLSIRVRVRGLGVVLFCHATPRSDTEIFTRLSPDERVRTMFNGADAKVAVCGHTHMQFDRTVDSLRIVNAGSVGMPFADPGAYWLLLGPDVALRRTQYDFEAAAARIRGSAFPGADVFATSVPGPRSESEMLALYER